MLSGAELLDQLPQQTPFRFVDKVHEVDGGHIVCSYRLRPSAPFFRGHFPGQPIAPGVILLEAMAQAGVVLQGIYLLAAAGSPAGGYRTLFTDAQVEWHALVLPGEIVTTRGELVAWRRMRIRSRVEMRRTDGEIVATGVLGGMGVRL